MGSQKSREILLIGSALSENCELRRELQARAYKVATEPQGEDGLEKASAHRFDLVISDLAIPGLSGLEILKRLHAAKPRLPVILIDNKVDAESAIEAAKLGAYEYVVAPFKVLELVEHIARAASHKRGALSTAAAGQSVVAQSRLVGSSRVMQDLYNQIGLAADSPANVLIPGATGTGKELVARAIHQHGSRAKQPFIPVNCGAIPETLLENELFGHEPGAFTGAGARRFGKFEQANGGTLFLDEIVELNWAIQAKLLRVLQDHHIQRLGGTKEIALDARVVAATNQEIEPLIESGGFRRDLFYRLNGLTIRTPQLRDHPEDIPDLTMHFLTKLQRDQSLEPLSICQEAVDFFKEQAWPGNVRELENAVNRAALLARGRVIELVHAQEACGRKKSSSSTARRYRPEPLTDLVEQAQSGKIRNLRARVLEQAERSLFERVMAFAGRNKAKMARVLGITRVTLRQRLLKLDMPPLGSETDDPPSQIDRQGNRGDHAQDIRDRSKGAGPGSVGL